MLIKELYVSLQCNLKSLFESMNEQNKKSNDVISEVGSTLPARHTDVNTGL